MLTLKIEKGAQFAFGNGNNNPFSVTMTDTITEMVLK